jgi:hypothetical protein
LALDYDRGKRKEGEILNELLGILQSKHMGEEDAEKISKLIFSDAVRINPPEKEEHVVQLITMHPSGRGGGRSVKAGNITLDLRKLMEAVSNGTFAIVSSYQIPWLVPLAFIILWNSLWRNVEIEITENDAAIIWSMWVYRDRESNEIPDNGLLNTINEHFKKYGRQEITPKDLEYSLNNLEKIKCIKRSKNNPSNWWLCEWVRLIYR